MDDQWNVVALFFLAQTLMKMTGGFRMVSSLATNKRG